MKKSEIIKELKEIAPHMLESRCKELAKQDIDIPPSILKRINEYERVKTMHEFDAGFARPLAGIDEAGRGPLLGRVYAAAVILPENFIIEGINDSKKLSEKKRDELFDVIIENALSYSISWSEHDEIDEINIRNATYAAMNRAVNGLDICPNYVLVDGDAVTEMKIPHSCVIRGDATSMSIAAASILAKVSRDRYITEIDREYPMYGLAKNKGYGTRQHIEALLEYGPTPYHRKTFIKNFCKGAIL